MGIYATAGAKLYIGESLGDGQPIGDLLPGDYSGETWTEVKKLENIGSLGDTSEAISVNIIGDARTYKVKGTRDAGTMQVVAALDYSDAGQTAVLAAALLASLILAARMLSRMAIGAGPALAAFAAFSIATVGAVLPWLLMYFVW